MMTAPRFRAGIDIGGTFTDFVLEEIATGRVTTHKRLTTPADPSVAVLEGLRELLTQQGARGEDLMTVSHGTTLIANALIERKGAATGLVTTAGFRDVLEMGKEMRYDIYDLRMDMPPSLVPRPWRFEVTERLDHTGAVLIPVDPSEVLALADTIEAAQIESIAICLLHAYRNSHHEQVVRDLLRDHLPEVSISLSSEVAPEIREFERTSTVVCNAYVRPLAERYLRRLDRQLRELGYRGIFLLMLSNGGIAGAETAMQHPIRLAESGPAAGVVASAFFGDFTSDPDVVSFDMGGTTAKICLVRNAQPAKTTLFEIARVQRFRKGSGLSLRVPALEMIEIGAGGGSIAFVDELGLLKVGPRSAGASPGPACYALGGMEPTVTDADLVLGYLNPDYFLGGRMRLDPQLARRAIEGQISRRLGLSVHEAAFGIFRVVNEQMISATRVHVAERGEDPRRFALVAFGGAGPIHAWEIARALRIRRIICPAVAGVASALGLLVAAPSFDLSRSFVARVDQAELVGIETLLTEMAEEGARMLRQAGVASKDIRFVRSADMRYVGQGHEINVPLPNHLSAESREHIEAAFAQTYSRLFEHTHDGVPLEILTCRLQASGPAPSIRLASAPDGQHGADSALKGRRPVYFADLGGYVDCPIYDRGRLNHGARLSGPAIVEEDASTTVLGPRMAATVDPYRTLIIEVS